MMRTLKKRKHKITHVYNRHAISKIYPSSIYLSIIICQFLIHLSIYMLPLLSEDSWKLYSFERSFEVFIILKAFNLYQRVREQSYKLLFLENTVVCVCVCTHMCVVGSVSFPVDFPFGYGKPRSFPETLYLSLCYQPASEKKRPVSGQAIWAPCPHSHSNCIQLTFPIP